MADNVAITAGSGTTIATDDIAGVHYQRVKLVNGTLDDTTAVPGDASGLYTQGQAAHDAAVAGNPVLVGGRADTDGDATAVSADGDVARFMTDLQGRQIVRPVPWTTRLTASSSGLTTATTSYTAGDQLGAEISFASAVRVSGGSGVIRGVRLLDKADITGNVDVMFFRATVTPAADNAAAAFSDGDMDSWIGTVNLSMVDYGNNRGGVSACYLPFDCAATTLYCHMVTRIAHTFFGAVTDLALALYIQQD